MRCEAAAHAIATPQRRTRASHSPNPVRSAPGYADRGRFSCSANGGREGGGQRATGQGHGNRHGHAQAQAQTQTQREIRTDCTKVAAQSGPPVKFGCGQGCSYSRAGTALAGAVGHSLLGALGQTLLTAPSLSRNSHRCGILMLVSANPSVPAGRSTRRARPGGRPSSISSTVTHGSGSLSGRR